MHVEGANQATLHWAAGGVSASLLRALGTGQLASITRFVDGVRDAITRERELVDPNQIRERFLHEAFGWLLADYHLRLLSSLDDPHNHDRIMTVLWATSGALRPSMSDPLLLRTAIGASVETISQVTSTRPDEVVARLRQAGRRINAFALEIKPPSIFGSETRFRAAMGRLESLIDRSRRNTGVTAAATRCLSDLLALVRARLDRSGSERRQAS